MATHIPIGLEYECRFWAELRSPIDFGLGPYGVRNFFEVSGGGLTGDRLSGKLLSGGGDWALIGADGWARLDGRAHIETTDGARILLTYFGVLPVPVLQALATGTRTEYRGPYYRTTPRFETGDSRYAWLNQTIFVAAGRLRPGLVVEYGIFRVT